MSEAAISINQVGKSYRIFRSKHWRMLDALGLPIPKGIANEFWALRDVSFSIDKGERVGIIGRNGAGKSTLLKIIAGLIKPTTGQVDVRGRVHALMELGTGFHPDFTGRENISSSLAYLGVTGRAAEAAADEIIEFSELEEFIDQPFRTYSAGMQARLTFTVATSIQPEVMIVDEILGAGDAYFTAKAVARMAELTNKGCTLLFVSHDLSSVQMMCQRAVWIDRGTVLMDSDTLTVGKAYMASIRKQEEQRLRAKNLRLRPSDVVNSSESDPAEPSLLARLVLPGEAGHPKADHAIKRITLLHGNDKIDEIDIGAPGDIDQSGGTCILVSPGYTNWSSPARLPDGEFIRYFRNEKGRYFHAPFSLRVPLALGSFEAFCLEIEHRSVPGEAVAVEVHDGTEYHIVGHLESESTAGWRTDRFNLPDVVREAWISRLADVEDQQQSPVSHAAVWTEPNEALVGQAGEGVRLHLVDGDAYGQGGAKIVDVKIVGQDESQEEGGERAVFYAGEPMFVEIAWQAVRSVKSCTAVIAIYAMDGRCVTQVLSPTESRQPGHHAICGAFRPLRLGPGEYAISVGLFENLNLIEKFGSQPLDVHDRRYLIRVMSQPSVNIEFGAFLHEVQWEKAAPYRGRERKAVGNER